MKPKHKKFILFTVFLLCLVGCGGNHEAASWETVKLADATVGDIVWPFAVLAVFNAIIS